MSKGMVSKLSRAVLVIALIHFYGVWASAEVQQNSENACDASDGRYLSKVAPDESKTVADKVLEEADRVQGLTVEKVVEEDVSAKIDHGDIHVPGRKDDAFESVWTSAYQQWIATEGAASGTVKRLSPAAKRAIEEVQRRKGNAAQDEDNGISQRQKKMSEIEESMGESEVAVLEKAVLRLSTDSRDDLLKDLDLIEYLCHSGDNGNHFESIGGVGILLNMTQSDAHQAAHAPAVKALATCAQNNPIVFNRAVSDGAVSTLLGLADGADGADGVALRASALRALVSVLESRNAQDAFANEQERLLRVVKRSIDIGVSGRDERRSVLRGLAIVEPLLKNSASQWLPAVENMGIIEWCRQAIAHTDADIREAAALVVKTSESSLTQ